MTNHEIEAIANRVAELVRVRDEAMKQLEDILGGGSNKTEQEPMEEETPEPVASDLVECNKCQIEAESGAKARGRHNKGCQKSAPKSFMVEETGDKGTILKPPKNGKFEKDCRSDCCDARVLSWRQKDDTTLRTCAKCNKECVPYDFRNFECDDCGHGFEAKPEDVVKCSSCGQTNVWPVKDKI